MTLSNFLTLSGHDVNRGDSWCWGLSNNIFISSQTFKLDFTLHCLCSGFLSGQTIRALFISDVITIHALVVSVDVSSRGMKVGNKII